VAKIFPEHVPRHNAMLRRTESRVNGVGY
jgi:hypothetical protein